VIGLGQRAAGDDAVGLAVLEHLRQVGAPPGIELVEAAEATALIELLQTRRPVVVVDAVLDRRRPGDVVELAEEELAALAEEPRVTSTHGVGVAQAIQLARALGPGGVSPHITIVGVTIAQPQRYTTGLSEAVRRAVPIAARLVLARIGE
jgi:hydrogenase maturation protease